MITLGIESTCDETGASIVEDSYRILSNVVSSQIDLHIPFGGVVPELACRRHVDIIIPVIDEALTTANKTLHEIDLIAVAAGPGLIGALLIGINAAKSLSLALKKPIIAVNHIEAHLFAALMSHPTPITYPTLGVILSGGHSTILLMEDVGKYKLLGETIDDAIGEAFDKVAKMLGLPYPGGPCVEKLAKKGDPHRFIFKAGIIKEQPYHFSFSGLKTAVLYALKKIDVVTDQDIADLCASFQETAFQNVINKVKKAAKQTGCTTVVFGGGVTHSQTLRSLFASQCPELTTIWPTGILSLDNAAMIAGLGSHQYITRGKISDPLTFEPFTRFHY